MPNGADSVLDAVKPWRFAFLRARPERLDFDYCSQDLVPITSGTSRNRETMYSRQMGFLAENVK